MSESETKADQLVLVTGASGFIGAHAVLALLNAGYKVRGTVRDPDSHKIQFLRDLPGASERLQLVKLDLVSSTPEEFQSAISGCTLVQHVASPFPLVSPKDEQELIRPAVRGSTCVLAAAKAAGCVKRVVLTSSCAAVMVGHPAERYAAAFTEEDFSPLEGDIDSYSKSKTMAEQAAWTFMKDEQPSFELSVVNPSLVVGPALGKDLGSSNEVVKKVLNREMPALPFAGLPTVDVRDVASCLLLAMNCPQAAGKRFICSERWMWFTDWAEVLDKEFGEKGYHPPRKTIPYFAAWLLSWFEQSLKVLLSSWGRETILDNSLSQKVLGLKYSGVEQGLIDSGHSLIHHGHVKRTNKYGDQVFDPVACSLKYVQGLEKRNSSL